MSGRVVQSRRAGLTLIEVMLASAILAASLTALLTAASRCLQVMRRSREYQEAQWVRGMGELEYPLLFVEDIAEQSVSGVDYGRYTFSREVEDDEDEDGLYVVRTRVDWGQGPSKRYEEVYQYVYQAPETEQAER